MTPIKITGTNMDALGDALAAANGRATAHTFTTWMELDDQAIAAEAALERLGVPKAERAGAGFVAHSGGRLAKSYRFMARGTGVRPRRRAGGWYLTDAWGETIFPGSGPKRAVLVLTEARDREAIEVLRRGYRIAAAAIPAPPVAGPWNKDAVAVLTDAGATVEPWTEVAP